MGVIKEWNCIEHGDFVASHPICPENGCTSRHVTRVFLTAPMIGKDSTRRFDAGIRKSSEMMRISNFRSARGGEAAYGGDVGKDKGLQVLWGDQCRKVMGRSFSELTQIAHNPLVVQKRDGSGELRLERNNAMREAATEMGITKRNLPPAGEVRIAEKPDQAPAKKLVS